MSLYHFGFPDVLVKVHFPHGNQNRPLSESLPWFWWFGPPARPFYFQYIGTNAHPAGHGWQRTANFPMIKILGADTQTLVPTFPLGFTSLEDAIDNGAPDSAFGRFQFTDKFFWKVMGFPQRPEFTVVQGRPTGYAAQKPPISKLITQTVQKWKNNWNAGAANFNQTAASFTDDGNNATYKFPTTQFALPLPTAVGIQEIAAQAASGSFYLGPVPGGFWFMGGNVAIYKQAYSFHINVGQLDFNKWRMDVFPPQRTGLTPLTRGFETFDCSGYGQTTFPLSGPQIIGH